MGILIMILRGATTLIVGIALWGTVDGSIVNLLWIVPLAVFAGSIWVWVLGPLAVWFEERSGR